jgi:hypothetical protein
MNRLIPVVCVTQELLVSVTALAQLSYYDRHLMYTASQVFAQAVAAAGGSGTPSTATNSNSVSQVRKQGGGKQQQQQQELLPHVRDHQLIVNYLWANASCGYVDLLLLPAALQLLLVRGLVGAISRSHLPLCMWALAALLVCQLQQQQQQQQQQLLVQAVIAVHDMLAAQAQQLWLDSQADIQPTGSKGANYTTPKGAEAGQQQQPPFSADGWQQMYQARAWIQAAAAATAAAEAAAAAPASSSTVLGGEIAAAGSGLWSSAQLLAVAQQQQQQQQQQLKSPGDLSRFWQFCCAAWAGNRVQVSGLQQQVFQVWALA